MIAKIEKIYDDAKIPIRATKYSAGYDLYAYIQNNDNNKIVIAPGDTVKIRTGIKIQPPNRYFCAIFARSGLATENGIRPANCVGVCDEDYTGEYIVALHNDSFDPVIIRNEDRVAQLVFLSYQEIDFVEVDNLDITERGDGGFGSTGE